MSDPNYTLKADLHIHSHRKFRLGYCPLLYDSVQKVEEIIERALDLGIRIISITDHDSLEGYFEARELVERKNLNILLVPGCEISSRGGHILAYNVRKIIKKGLSAKETIEKIHEQGGIAVAPHPFFPLALKNKIFDLNLDAIEGYNSQINSIFNAKAVSAAKRLNLPCIAGSDAHQVEQIGNGLMLFPENTKTIPDVIENIKGENFQISFSRTKMPKMVIRHIYINIRMQLPKRN